MAHKINRQAETEREKEFLKRFNSLCQTRSSWQVWADFITAVAITLANTTEQNQKIRDKREKEFADCIERLGGQDIPAEMLGIITMALEENPEQDFLGNLFMKLELGNHWRGQFFTPYSLCELMAELNSENLNKEIEEKGWVSVNDCACGAGATLIAAANVFKKHDVNYQDHALFVAQDIDRVAGMMCYIQLSLLGCPGYVVIADSISSPATGKGTLFPEEKEDQEFWYTPMWYSDTWNMRRTWNLMDLMLRKMSNGL